MTKLSSRKRSGGPKTAEGKAVAARNSLKTGAYASPMILPGESEAEFHELKQSLLADLQAVGVLETSLVNELAAIVWKKLRVEQVEHRSVVKSLNEQITAKELYDVGLEWRVYFDVALNHPWFWDSECSQHLANADSHIERIVMEDELEEEVFEVLAEELPTLYWRLVHWARYELDSNFMSQQDYEAFIKAKKLASLTGNYAALLTTVGRLASIRFYREVAFIKSALEHKPKIEALIPLVMDRRLIKILQMQGVGRARDDLDRALFRGMKELRAQQEWRFKHQVIDVTPKSVIPKTD